MLSIVYRNETIWTRGYGLINMSGQLSILYYHNRVDLIVNHQFRIWWHCLLQVQYYASATEQSDLVEPINLNWG